MGYRGGGAPSMGPQMIPMTRVVKLLLIINVVIWFVGQIVLEQFLLKRPLLTEYFGLVPGHIYLDFFIWQPVSYMFLHAINPFHILFNMLLLWWLGSELEQLWGSRSFLVYYLVCGVGAALFYFLGVMIYVLLTNNVEPLAIPVIGASGAIFGLMVAYGLLFGERLMYFLFIFPMKAKYFVLVLGGIELVLLLNHGLVGGEVASLAHLGGLIVGFLFLMFKARWLQKRRRGQKNGPKLKLVVDNESSDDPKYWN